MTVMKTTGNNINSVLKGIFNEKELQAIKDTILYGAWGDTDIEFDGVDFPAWGFCTNDCSQGGHFKGREVTNIWKSISNKIKKTEASKFMKHANDWWGDGTGDMVFFRTDGFFEGKTYEGLVAWAKTPTRFSAEVRCGFYLKELKEIEGVLAGGMNFESSSYRAWAKKRIASLKRKIARAEKAMEKSLKNADEK